MQSTLLFISNLNNNKNKNIKKHYKLMAATIWEFGLRIAEKFFLYNEDAQEYARKILFMDLNSSPEDLLNHIQQDFLAHQIPYNDTEIHDLFVNSYNKSQEFLINNDDNDFYI